MKNCFVSSFLILLLNLCFSCTDKKSTEIDQLNDFSYGFHYRNLDSTSYYARKAYYLAEKYNYKDGEAEALNNLAFVDIVKMQYADAYSRLDSILDITDNHLELLIAYIQQMRLCQRQSQNREFYECREHAQQSLRRINEERHLLSERQKHRLIYAESELAIVTSTYYYYVGLERQSIEAIESISPEVENDTAQWLNYLYNVGAGGIITQGTQTEINQKEFDYLMRCYLLAKQYNCPYYLANSLEALAEHLTVFDYRMQLMSDNQPAMKFINPQNVSSEELPLWLAENALSLFESYGDTYQTAGAYRTLATCCLSKTDYDGALQNLELALSDTLIFQAPDLVASIREQLSVVYSAIDQKNESDYNRNIYLDLQERTRQDQRLEARAAQLEQTITQLNRLLVAVVIALILFVIIIISFYYHRKKSLRNKSNPELEERRDELEEQMNLTRLHLIQEKRLNVEQRAKLSLVNAITPLIDRMIHEIKMLDKCSGADKDNRINYICELTNHINSQNEILTHWIQLRKGELSLHIESFPLQELFDIIQKNRRSFSLKGIELRIEPTDVYVKADKVLTLFMLNTLADNARKFTAKGGTVSIETLSTDSYVEISVVDNGIGMSDEQVEHVFDRKAIIDGSSTSHGFGLLNCMGIINKYRKISQLFSVCQLSVESELGKGSRFLFRLPKRALSVIAFAFIFVSLSAQTTLEKASSFADSAYFSNIEGDFQRTLDYADSCRICLNKHFKSIRPYSNDTLMRIGDLSNTPPEINWFHDSIDINFDILLDIRNESAVAALALHQWQFYQYNNRIYTQLFKELSADSTLDSYCRKMQQSQSNKEVAIILLILLFIAIIIVVVWQFFLLHNKRVKVLQQQQIELDFMADELQRLKMEEGNYHIINAVLDNTLSTLKHETMYYPSRIFQLATVGDHDALPEVVEYYRELYGILSEQAIRQLDDRKMHLQALEHEVLGDAVYLDYLFDILRRQSGEKKLEMEWAIRDKNYVMVRVLMMNFNASDVQLQQLFMPVHQKNIPFLICREIVRQHGEATNRHACGIYAERDKNNIVNINIILPRICKTLK